MLNNLIKNFLLRVGTKIFQKITKSSYKAGWIQGGTSAEPLYLKGTAENVCQPKKKKE